MTQSLQEHSTVACQRLSLKATYCHLTEFSFFFSFQGEIDTLKLKLARLEREKKELEEANEKLQQKVHLLLLIQLCSTVQNSERTCKPVYVINFL